MKKILAIFVCLLAFGVASAQNKTTTTSGRTDNQDKATMKSKSDNNMQTQNTTDKSAAMNKKKRSTKNVSSQSSGTTNTKERANGTTGVQEYPDTQGAGTGTGNDSRKTPPPGQPENMAK